MNAKIIFSTLLGTVLIASVFAIGSLNVPKVYANDPNGGVSNIAPGDRGSETPGQIQNGKNLLPGDAVLFTPAGKEGNPPGQDNPNPPKGDIKPGTN